MNKFLFPLIGIIFLLILVPSFLWAEALSKGTATPLLPNLHTPTRTPLVIAEDDPPATPTPGADTIADHVGPALRIIQAEPPKRLVLEYGSRLWVTGSTSKRSFVLATRVLLGSAILKGPLDPSNKKDALLSIVKAEGIQAMNLAVPVDQLKSTDPNIVTSSDYTLVGPFYTLKGKDNPTILFRLEEETLGQSSPAGVYHLKATGKLSIAGVTRDIPMEAEAVFTGTHVHLTGVHPVRLQDFNIPSPSAVWGKMNPNDSVEVHFDLLFGAEKPVKN